MQSEPQPSPMAGFLALPSIYAITSAYPKKMGSVERPKRIDWLLAVPGFVAFALGLVYGIGAITIYGQLKSAGLNGVEAMAAVPLDQILSRGIGQAASTFGKALVYAFVIAMCAALVSLPEAATRGGIYVDGGTERTISGRQASCSFRSLAWDHAHGRFRRCLDFGRCFPDRDA